MISPPRTALDRLVAVLNAVVLDVGRRVAYGGISMPLNILISARIIAYRQRICDIVARIRGGTYIFRRRTAKPRAPVKSSGPPRPPGLVKQCFGWVLPLLPPYWNANGYSAELESLLADPEMVALIEAAPVALGRPLRSLCWMLRVKPPPHLAPARRKSPRRPSPRPDMPPVATAEAAAQAPLPASPPPASAPPARRHPPRSPRRRSAAPPPRACGPPHPA
jgi:hypothetical protein